MKFEIETQKTGPAPNRISLTPRFSEVNEHFGFIKPFPTALQSWLKPFQGMTLALSPVRLARLERLVRLICPVRKRISAFLATIVLLSGFQASTLSAAVPNVIILLADDLGWADLGCYGNTFNETPNLDRLAKQGMRFTQFYAGAVCSPTRANLQSGRDQARYGITQHIPGHRRPYAKLADPVVPLQLPLEVETFAERLRKVGYVTGYFGKWHLGKEGWPHRSGLGRCVRTHRQHCSAERIR
jgi:hypothetical protein